MPVGNILVADDDAAIRTVLNQALSRAGYEVRSTGNAATLWRWVADGEGDLVITDVIMPDENGLDLIPRIKKVRPELRVIVMSAQSTLLTAVKATERGAFEYLPKPFDLRELISVVTAALAATGIPLVGDPMRGIFRIYRDVRFSPDKRLYKTHAGAVLTRSGSKRDPGLLYLHVAPGESMVAAGFWHPEPALLSRLRRAILHDPDEFLAIKDRLIAAGHPIFSGERLSRPPRAVIIDAGRLSQPSWGPRTSLGGLRYAVPRGPC